MNLSIIMPSYNRLDFLKRALWSFCHNIGIKDFEVIVVDDASDYPQRADHAKKEFESKLNLKIILRTKKISRNAGIPFNQAAKEAKGTFLLITGPDFILMNSLDAVFNHFKHSPEKLIAACTYAVSKKDQNMIESMDISQRSVFEGIRENLKFLPKGILREGEEGWYCHPEYRPYGLGTPWLIKKDIFDYLGGFDEEFYRYFGFEDTDFLRKVKNNNIPLEVADDLLFIHQYHYQPDDKEDITNREQGYTLNRLIYERKMH